mgnify:CR=1 FL=1
MSDFLSNFTSDKYKKDAEEQELVTPDTEIPETAMENVTPDLSEVANYDAVSDDDVLADTTIRGLSCEMLDEETNAEDFNEKGANIAYRVQYVNSPETKGTVVGQSSLNEFVPLSCTIFIQISNGHEK